MEDVLLEGKRDRACSPLRSASDVAPATPSEGRVVASESLTYTGSGGSWSTRSLELDGDFALEAACGAPDHGKDYSISAYHELVTKLRAKATDLGGDWSASTVEQALFSAAKVPLDATAVKKSPGTKVKRKVAAAAQAGSESKRAKRASRRNR